MPRTLINTVVSVEASVAANPGAVDVANGNYYINKPGTVLHAKNTNVATRTITITPQGSSGGVSFATRVITLPATTGDLYITVPVGPFNGTDNSVNVDVSVALNVTIEVIQTQV